MPLSVLESFWDVLQGRFGSSLSNLSEGEGLLLGSELAGGEKSNLSFLGLCQPPLEHCSASQSLSPKYPSSSTAPYLP